MATRTVAGTGGLWAVVGTWVEAAVPTNADAVVVPTGNSVVVDVANAVALSLSVTGNVVYSTTANTTLTVQGKVTVNSGGVWNQGNAASPIIEGITANLILNNANGGSNTSVWFEAKAGATSVTTNGVESRTRWTTLTANVAANATTASFANTTGWAIGDEIVFAPTAGANSNADDAIDVRTITGLAPITFAALTWAHQEGAAVGNMYSNCSVKCSSPNFRGKFVIELSNTAVDVASIRHTKFENLGGETNGASVEINPVDNQSIAQYRTRKLKSFYGNIIRCDSGSSHPSWIGMSGWAAGLAQSTPVTVENNIFYHNTYEKGQAWIGLAGSTFKNNLTLTAVVGQGLMAVYEDNHFAGRGLTVGWSSSPSIWRRNKFYGKWQGLFNAVTNGCAPILENNDFGYSLPLTDRFSDPWFRNSGYAAVWNFTSTGDRYNTLKNKLTAETGYARHNSDSIGKYLNKNADITQQEIHKGTGKVFRDNSTTKRSTSSHMVKPLNTYVDLTHDITIPVVAGEVVEIAGYVQYDAAYYNSGTWTAPTAKLIDTDGTTVLQTFTPASSATPAWYPFILTGNASGTGNVTVRYTAKPSLTVSDTEAVNGAVYFDGIADAPLVVKARHYGFTFDETNPKRTRNAAVTTIGYTTGNLATSENTAANITGITVTGATSAVSITTDKTFQQLYDYTQAWSCLNLAEDVPVTGVGLVGNVALTAAGNVTLSTTKKLNGDGSLAMGANTLTADTPFDYTYTGGTFSQATTVPTFADGELTLPTAGTYTFTMPAGEIVFDATSAAWDLSGSTIDSGVTLSNTSGAGITVAMPAGYPTTTVGSGATEIIITAPAVQRGLNFTGLLAGSFVRVVKNSDQSELFADTNSATSETWDDATGGSLVVDYVIMKNGYNQIHVTGVTVTGAVGTGIQTVQVSQVAARWYQASTGGLAIGGGSPNVFANATTKLFGLTIASTLQNFASYIMEQWIALGGTGGAFANKPFPIETNGPASFRFIDGWEWDLTTYSASISNLSRDGLSYTNGSALEAVWAAFLTSGAGTGSQVRYQQEDSGTTVNAENTGEMDQLVQVYENRGAPYTNFDYRGHLVLKVQKEGHDQAEANVFTLYGALEDQLYVVGLTPTPNGVATGNPSLANAPVISQGNYTADSKTFSVKITDAASPNENTGEEIMRWLRFNFAAGGAFQGEDAFNWHDLVRTNGSKFKTVNGIVYGTATTKGVLVVKNDGNTPHPDFNLFTADNGDIYTPPVAAPITWAGALDGTTVLLYNDSAAGAIIDTQTVTGNGGYGWSINLPHANVAAGDSLRLRYGNKAYYADELQGTMTADGLSFVGSMTPHPVYAGWALNGATYDQANGGPFTMDGANLQIDIAAGSTSGTKKALGAWTQYLMTLPAGLAAFYGAWDLLELNQIRQNVSVVDVLIDVPTAGALFEFTDNDVNYYRSDFTYPGNIEAGHGLIAITYNAKPFVATTVGGNVVTGDIDQIAGKVLTAASVAGGIDSRVVKINNTALAGTGTAVDPMRPAS